ncbi:hypothetical protein JAO29_14425 [Edaphobacter sp. HDX4]
MHIFGGRRTQHSWQSTVFSTAVVLLLSSAGSTRLAAQSTFGSILESVQDASGAVIPGATVHIRNLNDNSSRDTSANVAVRIRFST